MVGASVQDGGGASYSQFACVGTGFSGIGLGATLKRWYGITDVRFFEREAGVGGTWLLNNYPGAASDIPNVLYCYSYEFNPDWADVLPGRDELLSYLERVADKYDVPRRTSFNTEVRRCEWVEERKRWRITARDSVNNTDIVHECQFLFAAAGVLDQPRKPDIPGLDNFKGPVFHTARWRHDVDLTGKNVAVFGNGCTGTQVIPGIASKAGRLTQFVRSKHWIVPSVKKETVRSLRLIYKYVPMSMRFVRYVIYSAAEEAFVGVYLDEKGDKFRKGKRKFLESYMRRKAPEKYHDMLIPDFEYGCKRRVFDAGYLACLHRENVELTDESPREVTSDHIVTKSGRKVAVDVIVLANGFKVDRLLNGIDVIGREETLEEHWESLGGPGAYESCSMNGFPNFFHIMGPNSATSHTSAIMFSENVVNLALRQIKPILGDPLGTVEVTREAEEAYVQQLQKDLANRVWNTGCNGWYVAVDDAGKFLWNAATYPYSQAHFWYTCLFPEKAHWQYTVHKKAGLGLIGKLLIAGVPLGIGAALLSTPEQAERLRSLVR